MNAKFEDRMPEGHIREKWRALPDSGCFLPGDEVYSLCHNCTNIINEMHPDVNIYSLWELLDADNRFEFPDFSGMVVTIQDCWRSRERRSEQEAVRSLLKKMNIKIVELEDAYDKTDFCGSSLYRSQPTRNPKLAPRHYVVEAAGKFVPHTQEEQIEIMKEYGRRFVTDKVVCYCHYCLEGLLMGGVDGKHIAELLF